MIAGTLGFCVTGAEATVVRAAEAACGADPATAADGVVGGRGEGDTAGSALVVAADEAGAVPALADGLEGSSTPSSDAELSPAADDTSARSKSSALESALESAVGGAPPSADVGCCFVDDVETCWPKGNTNGTGCRASGSKLLNDWMPIDNRCTLM